MVSLYISVYKKKLAGLQFSSRDFLEPTLDPLEFSRQTFNFWFRISVNAFKSKRFHSRKLMLSIYREVNVL